MFFFRKFDVGIYTVITSVSPLRVYIYESNFLIRFCTKNYKPFNYENNEQNVIGDIYTPIWEVNFKN